jgi:hypothetical protein
VVDLTHDRLIRQFGADPLMIYLRPWSIKKIRTHFDVLSRQGLITAERDHTNGPSRYEVPEEHWTSGSIFANLPTAQELEAQFSDPSAS